MVHKFTVEYLLNDEQYEKLKVITDLFNLRHKETGQGDKVTMERQFGYVMEVGCKYDIDNRLDFFLKSLQNKKDK